ncbi:Hypothetical_protein [Hexamita inflata]|uniref:Hypothetical_protein n=1 Tax=Hexamita inflata TaxID=28002 RepID=A0AA86UX89_9EUKA|nr:Hypothetical protein HINF_LOCUS63195 [Hexamita inflata]
MKTFPRRLLELGPPCSAATAYWRPFSEECIDLQLIRKHCTSVKFINQLLNIGICTIMEEAQDNIFMQHFVVLLNSNPEFSRFSPAPKSVQLTDRTEQTK